MFKFKKTTGEDSCGYKYEQHVLQSPDVDAKIVDRDGDIACHIDTDTEGVYLSVRMPSKAKGLAFAKKQTIELVGHLAPNAKPGKRSV